MKPESCYWDEEEEKLVGNRITKIREYLREGLIKEIDYDIFILNPTKGRHQTHTVYAKLWTCTCQAYHTGKECSHILAIKLFLKQRQEGGRNG